MGNGRILARSKVKRENKFLDISRFYIYIFFVFNNIGEYTVVKSVLIFIIRILYVYIVCLLYRIFLNLIRVITRHDIDKIEKQYENSYKNCKIFTANMYWIEYKHTAWISILSIW